MPLITTRASVAYGAGFGKVLGGGGAVDAGSMFAIDSVTVPSSGASSVTFSSIPSTYTHLQIRTLYRTNRNETNDILSIRFNSDTGANYSYHLLQGDGSSASAGAYVSDTKIWTWQGAATNASANIFGAQIIDILDYANTNKNKTIKNLGGTDLNGVGGAINLTSGRWGSNSAINSITLNPGLGGIFVQYSSFALYGIKGA